MPFFGIPIRNGLPIGLGSVAGFGISLQFSPAELFSNGEQGVWYDPSDVNLNWRRNLLTYTEQFDVTTGGWGKTGTNVTADAVVAPDGTLTADEIIEQNTTQPHLVNQISAVPIGTYTFSVYAKQGARNYCILSFSTSHSVSIDLATGLIEETTGSGTVASVTDAGGGWWRFSLTATVSATSNANIYISTDGIFANRSYTGNVTSNIYLWGAQLEQSSTATAYQQIITPEITYLQTIQSQPVLFQDSAGTTPVTAAEQPVGLMLDKSKGLVLGSELVTNGDFSSGTTGWTLGTGAVITDGQLTFNRTTGNPDPTATNTGTMEAGKAYLISFDVISLSAATNNFGIRSGSGTVLYFGTGLQSSGAKRLVYFASSTGTIQIFSGGVAPLTTVIDNVSVRELPGNHAYQSTSASRPTLRARYNLLTYTEEFDTSAWASGISTSVVANTTVSPNGGINADTVTFNITTPYIRQLFTGISNGSQYTLSFYAKSSSVNGATNIRLTVNNTSSWTGATGVKVALTTSWQRITVTWTSNGTQLYFIIGALNTSGANDSSCYGDVDIWGAQLIVTNSLPSNNYQRVAAATDYDTSGFLPYLSFDGTDDSMLTNSIDFSAGATNVPLGSELVTNGTFDTNITGWTVYGDPATTATYDNGRCLINAATTGDGIFQGVTTVVGRTYRMAVDFERGTTAEAQATTNATGGAAANSTAISGTLIFYFVASSTTTFIRAVTGNSATGTLWVDNISVKELLDLALAPDKMTVWAGVRKLSDATAGIVVELSATSTNAGSFGVSASNSSAANYQYRNTGSLSVAALSNNSYAAPITNVLTGIGDISGDVSTLRVNAVQAATNTGDQGTGNFGNYPLYIGRRNNATLPFNGWLTSLIVRGAQSTDAQIDATENWVNGKTGAQFDFVVRTSDGGGYSVPFTALNSSGTSYNIPNTVRSSSGASYII